LIDIIAHPPPVEEMPDWLKADITSPDVMDLESIFAQTQEEPSAPSPVPVAEPAMKVEIDVDPSDPWVEAFDLEHEQGMEDISSLPAWYQENLNDPERIAAVERQAQSTETEVVTAIEGLSDEPLPVEADLPAGAPQELPEWMQSVLPVTVEEVVEEIVEVSEVEPAVADIPDWLREVEAEVTPEEIPDWLKETLDTDEEELPVVFAQPEPIAQVVIPEPPRPTPPPAPRPAFVGTASLESARAKNQSGDLDACLVEYEALVRGSVQLEVVVDDLSTLVKTHKSNPAVYRVLGDGLMRQGKLQAALDTYREALNQL
jgi:hypothetical protein